MNKIDISSTTLEKGVEIAKEFLDKLVAPAAEEVGLLLRDTVALWKFKNQVRVLTKAKAYCERNGISPSNISLKLLCPLLESAALEEDEDLQDRWAVLLANLVDSEQNIQNHVFPYILSQLSANEFSFLERVYADKLTRMEDLNRELSAFRVMRSDLETVIVGKIADVDAQIKHTQTASAPRFDPGAWKLHSEKRQFEAELASLDYKDTMLQHRIAAPQVLPESQLREFELSNIVRLGLAREVQDTYANPQTLEIPLDADWRRESSYVTVDLDVEVISDQAHVLTELGELFVRACTEKQRR